jgi:hypothetical protein
MRIRFLIGKEFMLSKDTRFNNPLAQQVILGKKELLTSNQKYGH